MNPWATLVEPKAAIPAGLMEVLVAAAPEPEPERTSGKKTRMRVGDRFGQWTVIDYKPGKRTPEGIRNARAVCLCDCGTEREVWAWALYMGRSKSCGHDGPGRPPRSRE